MQKIVFSKSLRNNRARRTVNGKSNADIRELVKVLIVLSLAITGVVLLIIFYSWIKVDDIKCQTQRGRCTPEMLSWMKSFEDAPTPWAAYKINEELAKEFQFVEKTKSVIVWPAKINVDTVIKAPALTVTTRELLAVGTYYLVTFDGVLIEKITNAIEPILVLEKIKTPLGQKLEPINVNAIQIAYHMSSLGYKFQAKIVDNNLYVMSENLDSKKNTWFGLEDKRTPAELVSAYQIILKQATLSNTPATIDMRYVRPVVRNIEPAVAGESVSD